MYESRAYTGSNMLSRITEAALATMVLAVVNQYHARLHTPLQVCIHVGVGRQKRLPVYTAFCVASSGCISCAGFRLSLLHG